MLCLCLSPVFAAPKTKLSALSPKPRAKEKEKERERERMRSRLLSKEIEAVAEAAESTAPDDDDVVSVNSHSSLTSAVTNCTPLVTRRRQINSREVSMAASKVQAGSAKSALGIKNASKLKPLRASVIPSSSEPPVSTREFVSSAITWSLLSVSYDGNDFAGYMYFLVMASVHSAKKKNWCILIDGLLMTFSSITDLKTKESIELKYCHVAELADGVIEIIYGKETPQKIWYYLLACNPREKAVWLQKFHALGAHCKTSTSTNTATTA